MNGSQHATTFGAVVTSDLAKKVVIEVLNGLLLNVPEMVLLTNLRQKYGIEQASLEKLIDAMTVEYNNIASTIGAKSDLIAHYTDLLTGYNPVGLAYQDILKKRGALSKQVAKDRKAMDQLDKRQAEATSQLRANTNKQTRSLSEWAVDHPDEYANDSLRSV